MKQKLQSAKINNMAITTLVVVAFLGIVLTLTFLTWKS